jgi:hypothetical protein
MEILVEIIKTVIWPATVIVSVVVLRKGILELIPNLKKLKYKDLEVEFEKEAIKLRAIIERDIPHIEPPEVKPPELAVSEPRVLYSTKKLSPSEFILHEWNKLEKAIISLLEHHNIDYKSLKSIRFMTDKLRQEKIIDSATEDALLELNAYRNKIAHAHDCLINYDISNAYFESSKRMILYLNTL